MTNIKLHKTWRHLLAMSLLGFLIFLSPSEAYAIGQVTKPIAIKSAQRGQQPQETMIVMNNENAEIDIDLLAKGDIEKWVKFYPEGDLKNEIKNIKMPASTQKRVVAMFYIPGDVPNGKYTGKLTVSKKASASYFDKEQSGVSVSQQIDRDVTIEVSDNQVIDYKVSVIPHSYDLKKDETLQIRLIYDNRSNVMIKPQAQIKIKKDNKVVYNSIYPFPEDEEGVRPGAIQEIPPIQIPTNGLEKGKYATEISFTEEGKTIFQKNFTFSIDMFNNSGFLNSTNNATLTSKILGLTSGNPLLIVLFVLTGIYILLLTVKFKQKKEDK